MWSLNLYTICPNGHRRGLLIYQFNEEFEDSRYENALEAMNELAIYRGVDRWYIEVYVECHDTKCPNHHCIVTLDFSLTNVLAERSRKHLREPWPKSWYN